MINFRFHIVSILAVFLAIAIGTVMGASFVGRGVVDRLQQQVDTVRANADEEHARNGELETENAQLQQYADESAPFAVARTLTGVPVTVVAERGVDGAAVDAQAVVLEAAGADVRGIVWLEERWQLDDADSAAALREATGLSTRGRGALRAAAAGSLGARLAPAPGEPSTPTTSSMTAPAGDVLANLVDQDFVALDPAPGAEAPSVDDFGTPGSRVLLVGGPASPVPPAVMLEVVSGVVVGGGLATVGEIYAGEGGEPPRSEWIDPYTSDDELRNRVSTVDDAEHVAGRVAATLALAGAASGTIGQYGLDRDRMLPETVPAPPVAA
jgi:hypothetical protein